MDLDWKEESWAWGGGGGGGADPSSAGEAV